MADVIGDANIGVNDNYSHRLLPRQAVRAYFSGMVSVRTNIESLRKARGWTQMDLASASGLSQATISKAEAGEPGTRLKTFMTIAAALNVQVAALFSAETTEAENILLEAFRRLSPDRKRGWADMARAVSSERQTEDR